MIQPDDEEDELEDELLDEDELDDEVEEEVLEELQINFTASTPSKLEFCTSIFAWVIGFVVWGNEIIISWLEHVVGV